MAKRVEDLTIIGIKILNKEFFILELSGSECIDELLPGQFVQVKVEGSPETFLRRPISIHDVDYNKKTLKLLVQIVGKGTEALSKLVTGNTLNIIYPLGNSFSQPEPGDRVLLVGGGCGIAPLLFQARFIGKKGIVPDILLGFRNSSRVLEIDDYKSAGNVFITTEDGSVGEKGFVTNSSLFNGSYNRIYCCGPESMMKAVGAWALKNNVFCEVSLENLMACGIGACLCCVAETVNGNQCTCIDGPVFNINVLKW